MYAHEQERQRTEQVVREVDNGEAALRACEEQMREAEQAAKVAAYRAEALKWKIDGRGVRPRRPTRRGARAVRHRHGVR